MKLIILLTTIFCIASCAAHQEFAKPLRKGDIVGSWVAVGGYSGAYEFFADGNYSFDPGEVEGCIEFKPSKGVWDLNDMSLILAESERGLAKSPHNIEVLDLTDDSMTINFAEGRAVEFRKGN